MDSEKDATKMAHEKPIEMAKKDDRPKYTYTLEEAVEEAKFGKCQIILTMCMGLSLLGSSVENTNVSYILPYAKCDLRLSLKEQGFLSGISYFGIVFSSHLWGFLADTWGRKKVLRLAATGAFISSFSSVFAPNKYVLILLRFLAGSLVAGATSAGYPYISEFHTSSAAPRAAAFISIGLNVPWVIMSPLATLLIPMDWSYSLYFIEFTPWRLFLLCTSLINLFNAILSSFIPESPKFLLAMNRKEEALKVLRLCYAINTGKSANSYPVRDIESVTLGNSISNAKGLGEFFQLVVKQTTPIFRKPLLENTWKFCYIIFVVFLISHGTFMWFPDFLLQLQSYHGTPKTLCEVVGPKVSANSTEICNIDNKSLETFQVLFIAGLCFVSISMTSSFYMKKLAPKYFVCTWFVVSTICGLLVNFVSNFYVIIVSFVIFLSSAICSNMVMAVAVNLFPTNYRAMAMAFTMIFGRIGSVSGSSLIGFLLQDHCPLIFYLYGGILISCALVFAMVKIKPQ